MLSSGQSELFNRGYGAYRNILELLAENADKLSTDDDGNTMPALVMLADMEIQKMLLDISSCDEYSPTEDEQDYIKSLIESTDALKALIPGYGRFYHNMTPANYARIKEKFDELSKDVPLALGLAVELQKQGIPCVDRIIGDYQTIFDSFSAISDYKEDTQNEKISDWLTKFKSYANSRGININVADLHVDTEYQSATPDRNDDSFATASSGNKTSERLPDLEKIESTFSESWIGTVTDVKNLCKAFMRRYAGGKHSMHPKTHIVILGSESRGKVFAAKCLTRVFKEYDLTTTAATPIVDFSDYPAGTDFIIFLSDLYRALYQISDVIVFAHFEMADKKQLDTIYQLMSKEIYHLDRRYVDRNGMLMDATGVLAIETISEISSNGKTFVFTSTLSQVSTTEFLGGRILSEITDIVVLDALSIQQIKSLADVLCEKFIAQCRRELSLNVAIEADLKGKLIEIYDVKSGAKGVIQFFRLNIFNPLSELCLSGRFKGAKHVELTYENSEFWAVDEANRAVSLTSYVRSYNQVELEKVKKEMASIIGLEAVKGYINELKNNINVQKLREKRGLKISGISMHMIFTGNPGTGKTTIARLVAKYLKAIGILTSGHLVEVTRADLVAQYVGQTAPKTTAAINAALGGVLFIDEAYSLYREKHDSFGIEAIDALVKGMEDHRSEFVVILAGYTDEMDKFMKSNPGLKSRFPNIIHFEDYSVEDMYLIAESIARSKGYKIDANCFDPLCSEFEKHQIKGRNDSGNGRLARNMIEKAILRQSQRIAKDSNQDLEMLILDDFGLAEKKVFDLEAALSEIVGMDSVKNFIRGQYKLQQANLLRQKSGFQVNTSQSLNMIFTGNPGTGKTTMARVVAKMFHELGILKSGHLVETDKSGLVAQYVGHTAEKTEEVFKSALGGVLFIDEAYAITNDDSSFGQECVDTLVKLIEDYRGETLVILAGYSKEMKEFMKSNSGLESRFPLFIEFPDYSAQELYLIGKKMISSRGFHLSEDGAKAFEEEIIEQNRIASENSGNGRLVRNMVESIIRRQSVRIVDGQYSPQEYTEITDADITDPSRGDRFNLEEELSKIVGLDEVKEFVRTQHMMCLAREKRRQADVRAEISQSLNMIFTGNPGTGKTTVARLIAHMFKSMGALRKGHIVETDKAGLIAPFVGQTAQKTTDVFKSAVGGILFIDEAYSITNDGGQFGQECVDTLVKLIEDYKGKIIVILAGYSKEMNEFIKSNSGLESRFPLKIEFPDYSAKELFEIGKIQITNNGFALSKDAEETFSEEINRLKRQSDSNSGNGRMVRNFVEEIIRNQSARIAMTDVDKDVMNLIIPADIQKEHQNNGEYNLEDELGNIIGLETVKDYVRKLNARLLIQEKRRKAGIKFDDVQTLHMIFSGNPGTGKTMMARTISNVLFSLGLTSKNKLIETDRSELVAGYVGQTAIKTREVVERALGGVLFIDEAYSLAQGGENDFGQEAIDTLVKLMDDYREKLVVILAGYSENMKSFLSMNPGLQSRFANIIEFPDYSVDQLMQIAEKFYGAQGYSLTVEAKKILEELFVATSKTANFGNGRFVRNVFEKSINAQSLRLSGNSIGHRSKLSIIQAEDIEKVMEEIGTNEKLGPKIGFGANL